MSKNLISITVSRTYLAAVDESISDKTIEGLEYKFKENDSIVDSFYLDDEQVFINVDPYTDISDFDLPDVTGKLLTER